MRRLLAFLAAACISSTASSMTVADYKRYRLEKESAAELKVYLIGMADGIIASNALLATVGLSDFCVGKERLDADNLIEMMDTALVTFKPLATPGSDVARLMFTSFVKVFPCKAAVRVEHNT